MQFLVYRGAETIPMTGVQELQALRISNSIAQKLETEGAKIESCSSNGLVFTGGLFSGALKGSPMIPIGSGVVDILAGGGEFTIRYKLCFDQWVFIACFMGVFLSAVVYSVSEPSSAGILVCIAVPWICYFGIYAVIGTVKFKKLISSGLKN